MNDTAKRRAEELTEKAVAAGAFEDFREPYRARLRWLKDSQPQAFTRALAHFNNVLVPNIAAGNDAIAEWVEYGKLLGELSGRGRVLSIDASGKAAPLSELRGLILHVPDDLSVPALPLAMPRELSDAQRATMQLLIKPLA